ncbi:hypothetical protein V8C86DRAFT_3012807 [Haematococcus lacustris]
MSAGGDEDYNALPDAVLKLKGLPYSATEAQILDFFKEFRVVRIAFVGEPDGRPSGLAFAEFETRDEAVRALSKNGQFIGERYVRLLHVTKNEMEEQSRLGTLAIPGAAAKLRTVRGLPYRSSPADILAFFQGYQYLPDSLQIGLDTIGRPSGEAWLSFSSPQEAMRSVKELNRQFMGNRYLELSLV